MKKIYITGIAGLLGSNLAYLLKDKYEIYGCDRNKVLMSGVKASAFDILDRKSTRLNSSHNA